ncbi:hypothetical protein EJD97_021957 [Solanum chilense]|uniref:Peptidase A1 domain-containing protein n=1 Tax=Solanum chilense TaxID=4083 RepID=A0A6N2AWH3_SOLCI|nr:hypothetical protein EJD97_021957 [Solanum chilense]
MQSMEFSDSIDVVSQLSSRGISGKVFSHCLNGGGILVLGEIQNPSMVYTPLVPSTYKIEELFLIHLVAEAYDSVINAINIDIPSSVESTMSGGTPCYLVSSRSPNNVTKIFPRVALNFAGGVSMELRPTDYLSFIGDFKNTSQWCILLISKAPSMTILGDIALRDKSIVYDLAHQRIGWADQDCSLPMNVSISSGVVNFRVLFHILSMLCIFLFWG